MTKTDYAIWSWEKDRITYVYETSKERRGTQIILQVPTEDYHLPKYDRFKPIHERSDYEKIMSRQ